MGLSEANNIGFNEPFGCCLPCSHRLYSVALPEEWAKNRQWKAKESSFLVMHQIKLLRLLLQHLSKYLHVMSNCHKDQSFIKHQNPKVYKSFDLLHLLNIYDIP